MSDGTAPELRAEGFKMHGPRITLSAADVWADPHAGWNACIEVWCMSLDEPAPQQRPAALAWRYTGEINNGGHLQYFVNLDDEVDAIVPETITAWRALVGDTYADILDEAYRRWTGYARLRPADLADYAAVEDEREFDSFDTAYYALNIKPTGGDESSDLLERHYQDHSDRYVVITPPVTANDRLLLALGDLSSNPDRGLAAWRTLAENENSRVRLRAARTLLPLDRDVALHTLKSLEADGNAPLLVRRDASSYLFSLEMEEQRRAKDGE
jgi:Domain of unknown function (DUF4375)